MEDSHSPTLTEADGAAQILLRGIDDWVSLAEAQSLVSMMEPGTPDEVHAATLRAITLIVDQDLAQLGELTPRFEPWALSKAEGLHRVRREWWDPERDLTPGAICWIENTPAGDAIAHALEAARDG